MNRNPNQILERLTVKPAKPYWTLAKISTALLALASAVAIVEGFPTALDDIQHALDVNDSPRQIRYMRADMQTGFSNTIIQKNLSEVRINSALRNFKKDVTQLNENVVKLGIQVDGLKSDSEKMRAQLDKVGKLLQTKNDPATNEDLLVLSRKYLSIP